MSDETPPVSGNRWEQAHQPVEPVPAYDVAEPSAGAPWRPGRGLSSPAAPSPCCSRAVSVASPSAAPPQAAATTGSTSRAGLPASTATATAVASVPPSGSGQVPDSQGTTMAHKTSTEPTARTHDRPPDGPTDLRDRPEPRRGRRRCPGRRGGAALARAAPPDLLVGGRRRPPSGFRRRGRRPRDRPADRPRGVRAAAGAGGAHGPRPGARAGLRPGPTSPAAPPRRLHLVQPDARAHRPRDRRVRRRRRCSPTPGDVLEPHRRLPRDAARARGTLCLVMVVVTSIKLADAGSATSRGTCCTSTPTSASASPFRTSSGPAAVPRLAGAGRSSGGRRGRCAAGAILVWRVGLPVVPHPRHDLRVTSVVREADGVVSVYLTGRDLDALRVEAGQFFTWRFLGRAAAGPGRTPTRSRPRPTAAACGSPSRTSATAAAPWPGLRPGTRVLVEGPYGRLSAAARTRRQSP